MAIQGFCPPPPPSPSPSPPSHSPSPYYQLLERGSARLGRVKKKEAMTARELGKVSKLSKPSEMDYQKLLFLGQHFHNQDFGLQKQGWGPALT